MKPCPRSSFLYTTNGRINEFDQLFPATHGIRWTGNAPLVVLLRGSEGSGKSTLALQLACLGETRRTESAEAPAGNSGKDRRCVFYYIVDDIPERIREKFNAFGIGGNQDAPVTLWQGNPVCAGGSGCSVLSHQLASDQGARHGTTLFLVDYCGQKRFDDLRDVICADVEVSASLFDECVVVIDSISPLKWVDSSAGESGVADDIEHFFSDFPQAHPSVIILIDEEESRPNRNPYLTDVYIKLWQGDLNDTREQGYCERYLQVVKASSCVHLRGPQKFRIQPECGIHVLPSLISSAHTLDALVKRYPSASSPDTQLPMVALGLSALANDQLIAKGSSSVLVGPKGCLKTPISLMFCKDCLRQADGKVVFICLHDRPSRIEQLARQLGVLDELGDHPDTRLCASHVDADVLRHVTQEHRFVIQYLSLAFIPPGGFVTMLRDLLRRIGHRPGRDTRVVIAAVSDLQSNYPRLTGVPGFLSGLVNVLSAHNVTSLFLYHQRAQPSAHDADREIVELVDNVFTLQTQTMQGQRRVLLHAKRLGGRLMGSDHVFYVERESPCGDLKASPATGEYFLGEDDRLCPAELRLYVNQCAEAQKEFNISICRSFGVPAQSPYLDVDLAHGRFESILDLLDRLRRRKDWSCVVAIDSAYLAPRLLDRLASLEVEREESFVNISAPPSSTDENPLALCRDSQGVLKALPVFVDSSLTLCNLEILDTLAERCVMLQPIRDALDLASETTDRRSPLSLPTIRWEDLRRAAEAFQDLRKSNPTNYDFFGFRAGPNPEPLICMFYEFLLANGICFYTQRPAHEDTPTAQWGKGVERWKQALLDFASFYLPVRIGSDCRHGRKPRRTARDCLFFHTWHSLAVADNVPPTCIPVKFGENWQGTRGGWCWGVVDNGVSAKGGELVAFAASELMNGFLIAHRVGVPPRKELCRDTGVLSVYNLGLMRRVIETETWARAHVEGYSAVSAYAYLFFSEFLSFVESLSTASENNLETLKKWLDSCLPSIKKSIPEVGF